MPPYNRARALAGALAGLLCFVIAGVLAVIDALSVDYTLELGPLGLFMGTGTVLLVDASARKIAERIINGGGPSGG